MKKILLLLVCVMATMTMGLKAQDNAKNLSQGQWNHGLAIGAQWIATDLGFAQAEKQVIARTNENYSLDDLRVMYGSKDKWVKFYDKLKAHENETGDVEKLVATIAAEYDKGAFIKNKVKSDVEKYNATHNGDQVGATPAGEQPVANAAEGSEQVITAADSTADVKDATAEKKEDEGGHGGHGLLWLFSVLGLALGAIGTFLAMQARKDNQAIAHDVNDDIKNLQNQIDKLAGRRKKVEQDKPHMHHGKHEGAVNEMEGIATTKKIDFDQTPAAPVHKPAEKKQEQKIEKPAAPAPAPVKKDPKPEEPKQSFGEPRILFMAKPDENDNFSRSAATYEPGNSIFELTTMDGKSGSFTVINKADAHKLALLMPGDTLTRACSGNNIQSSAGKTRIVTDRAGRAQLENGKWHIVVKAIVHYE